MRRIALLSCAAVLIGCAKSDQPAADTTPVAPPPAPPPKTIALSDVAGKWNVKGMNEAGDSTLVTYVFNATADTTGWTMTFPGRKPVPVHVVGVSGDSIMIEAGPYPSVLRKGVNVRTSGAFRLQDGKIVGMTTARYSVKTADSVRKVRTEGMKAP